MNLLRFVITIAGSVFGFLLTSSTGQAQLSMSSLGTPAVINFEGTLPGVGFGAWAGAGFEPGTTTIGRLDSNAWAMTGWSDGGLPFGGTQTTANTDYTRGITANPVAATNSGVYSFSAATIGSRSLGFQPGLSDFVPGTVTLRAVNNTGTTLTSIDVSYDLFVRNDQTRANSFNAAFSVDDVSYTNLPALNYTSTEAAEASVGFVLNQRNITITGLTIPNGQSFYFRWLGADVSGTGSRDEFALDNISLTAVPEPASILVLAAFGLGLGRTIRRKFGQVRHSISESFP